MDIKVALKNALGTIQTPTTAANYGATDLVPLFDSNDQLIGKISRNELMSAVKTSLGTLLNQGAADLGTSLAKIPALNSGGTLGSATVANLASVLGGAYQGLIGGSSGAIDLNDVTNYGAYGIGSGGDWANISHKPESANNAGTLFVVQGSVAAWRTQIVILQGGKAYYRNIYPNAQYNTSWVCFSTDIPDFYKNYGDLASLSVGLNSPIRTAMGSNHDPDTYLDTSCGYCEIDASKSPTGAYRGWGFLVIRLAGDFVVQFITPDNTSSTDIYYRKYYRGSFSEWKKII